MNDNSVRPTGFGCQQRAALAMAGTIPLPSPYPASGKVFLVGVSHSHTPDEGRRNGIDFYFKSVQVISERNVVSRTLETDSVRAIGFQPRTNGHDRSQNGGGESWTVVPVEESSRLAEATQQLKDAFGNEQNGTFEVLLYDRAVLYVREAAPVLHHQELGITAAVSTEAASLLADMVTPVAKGCC